MKRLIYILVFAFVASSCEKVIQLELNDSDPVVVVEGDITTEAGPYTIKLTRSKNYFEDNAFPALTGANVTVTDDQGGSEVLTEIQPGIYELSSMTGTPGRTYSLTVEENGNEYSASAKMQNMVEIDTLLQEYQDGSLPFVDSGYYVNMSYQDPVETNYYQVRVYRNGEIYDRTINHDTYEDAQFNGNAVSFTLLQYPFELGDTAMVELIAFDEKTYDYFISLIEVNASNDQNTGAIPQNPPTNISNGALGLFGAFAVDRKTIVFQ